MLLFLRLNDCVLEPMLYIYFEYLLLLRRLTINAKRKMQICSAKPRCISIRLFFSYQTMLVSTMTAALFIQCHIDKAFLYLNTDFCHILMAISYVNV